MGAWCRGSAESRGGAGVGGRIGKSCVGREGAAASPVPGTGRTRSRRAAPAAGETRTAGINVWALLWSRMVEILFRNLERETLQWHEEVNKIFLKQLGEVSREQTLILVQYFLMPFVST